MPRPLPLRTMAEVEDGRDIRLIGFAHLHTAHTGMMIAMTKLLQECKPN
uniref:Uncharacterized protein n=1 Tax=Rhizobium rhizogenes (strain K84 / ATCC BAA-868) TaxID=311403 RepID=B2Z3S9_RHIR8|nr:hypothetical protein [Rhizobium rhizogenes K84]